MTDTDVLARAGELVADALAYDERHHMAAETAGQHMRNLATIAAAGLALRGWIHYTGQGVDLNGPMGGTVGARHIDAYDAAIRAALAPAADAGAEAGEAGALRTGEEWRALLYPDMEIYDADGWRNRGWHTQVTQLTREQFEAAYMESTIVPMPQ